MSDRFDYYDDLLEPLIIDKSKQLGCDFVINDAKLQVVKELCEAIASLEDEMDFYKFKVGFNDRTGKLEFRIITGFFTIYDKNSKYYTLLSHANKLKISTEEVGESVELFFEFNNVWDYIGDAV